MRKDLHLKLNTQGSKKDQQKRHLYYSVLVLSTVHFITFLSAEKSVFCDFQSRADEKSVDFPAESND